MRSKNKEQMMPAPSNNNFNPEGRPKKEIDWNLFEQLCAIQCTQEEIASMLKVHADTLRDRAKQYYEEEDYSSIYKKFSETGKCSLRRNQFVLSKKNSAMAIWLGKIWLGQSDKSEIADEIAKQLSTHFLPKFFEMVPRNSVSE